eukprot:XP_003724637.1 PREDICTED: uncharacterized protein LOC100893942 [Strongylocentrotus purpuratus]
MASSTDPDWCENDNPKGEKSSCFIRYTKLYEKTSSFTKQSWSTFLKFTAQWWKYDCWQGEIARKFVQNIDLPASATVDQLALAELLAELPLPQAVYHRSCYCQYTDASKVRRAAAAKELRDKEAGNKTGDGDPQASNSAAQCLSSEAQGLPSAQSKEMLPPVCVLCKQCKFIKCKKSRKRKLEQLTACTAIAADRLIKAAEENDNIDLLREIKGRDCVAVEYHPSCYSSYTYFLTRKPTEKGEGFYTQSFKNFCEIVKERIIHKKEIMRLTELTSMFVKEVRKTDGVDIQGYRPSNLKPRLRSAFPQLCFAKPSQPNQGEIVYVVDIPTQELIEQRTVMRETLLPSSSAAEESSSEETNGSQHRQSNISLKDMYGSAQSLRASIEDTTKSLPGPPSAENLNENAAMGIVPPQLYNFVSWVVGASSEPEIRKHVEVADPKLRQQILNVCQDVIYSSSNGMDENKRPNNPHEHNTGLATREMNREDSSLPAGLQPSSVATRDLIPSVGFEILP